MYKDKGINDPRLLLQNYISVAFNNVLLRPQTDHAMFCQLIKQFLSNLCLLFEKNIISELF